VPERPIRVGGGTNFLRKTEIERKKNALGQMERRKTKIQMDIRPTLEMSTPIDSIKCYRFGDEIVGGPDRRLSWWWALEA